MAIAARFRQWVVPPAAEGDAEATRVARTLHALLLVGLAIDAVVGPTTALLGFWTPLTLALNTPRILVFVGLLALTRRGHPRLASILFVLFLWFYISLGCWLHGGLRCPMLPMFFPLVLIAALLLGWQAAVVLVGLTVGSGLVLILAERAHRLPAPVSTPSLEQVWVGYLASLIVVVAVALLATAELRRANHSLRAEIEERWRAEAERRALENQLLQSQKMEAVGRLAGGLAHDFNNLLMIITAHGEVLKKSVEPGGRGPEQIDRLMEAADRASQLVRQLLVFARADSPQPRAVDLNQLVREAAGMLQPTLGPKITLSTHLPHAVRPVHADPTRIQQALMNLAMNARDAMPEGGTLQVETANREVGPAEVVPPGRYVVLSVRDTGMGMNPEVRSRAFEPFFTTKAQGKGTGLGLAVAYGIVQQAGGHIAVESEPGQGTTFQIHLPCLPEDSTVGTAEATA